MVEELKHPEEVLPSVPAPRVLILAGQSDYAALHRIRRQLNELLAESYHISVICPTPREQDDAADFPHDVLVYRYPSLGANNSAASLWSFLCQLALTIWVLIGEGFDAIHAVNPPDGVFLIGGLFKFLFDTKFLFDCRILAPELYESRHKSRGLPVTGCWREWKNWRCRRRMSSWFPMAVIAQSR